MKKVCEVWEVKKLTDKEKLQNAITTGFSNICEKNNLEFIYAVANGKDIIIDCNISVEEFAPIIAIFINQFAKDNDFIAGKLLYQIRKC